MNKNKEKKCIKLEQENNCSISELGSISFYEIKDQYDENHYIWKEMMEEHHYLKQGKLFGQQIRYLIKSENYNWIGGISFSSASWQLEAREKWIGWNEENLIKHLNKVIYT